MDSELSWLAEYAPRLIWPVMLFALGMFVGSLGIALLRGPEEVARHPATRLWSWARLRLRRFPGSAQSITPEPASLELRATRACRYLLLGGALMGVAAVWIGHGTSEVSYLDYCITQSLRPRRAIELAIVCFVMAVLQWFAGVRIARTIPANEDELATGPAANMRNPISWASRLCWLAGFDLCLGAEMLLLLVVGNIAR